MESAFCEPVPDGTLLIETFAVGPEGVVGGAARVEMHLARLSHSARALGFAFDVAQARAAMEGQDAAAPLRARLTVGQDGRVEVAHAAMPSAAEMWRFEIHPERVLSSDPWRAHKTTHRGIYDAARAALPLGVDEWVFLNERGEICEGTITNIAVRFHQDPVGHFVTPPVSCGCLPGVFRQSQLALGRWSERVLTRDDLARAEAIVLCNALRGVIPARWMQGGGTA